MSVGALPLVGRETELGVLERALEAVGAGRSWVVGLVGEPGIGKSRLLGELGDRSAERGHLVFAGRASELERDVPFALWVEALDAHVHGAAGEALSGLEEEQLADLAVALPAVARVSGVAPAPTVERHRVARAVRALLEGLAATRPVTVLLDDVHWADPASGDAIALLLHRPPSAGVLFALAARSGRAPGVEDALHTAARHDGAELLEVEALSREAADVLLPAALGPATRARLYEESGGNPFYLQALTGSGVDGAGAPVASVGARVPRGVVAALVGEVSALAPAARLLVQGAAVAGDPFEVSVAAAASGVPEHEALAALDAVLAADLVRPTDRPRRFRLPASPGAPGGVRDGGGRLEAGRPRAGRRGAGGLRSDAGGTRAPRRAGGASRRPGRGRAARARGRADGAGRARYGGRLVRGGGAFAARSA